MVKVLVDGRRERRATSQATLKKALERLLAGKANHTLHRGRVTRITMRAVALEAGVSLQTLYRCPDVVSRIREIQGASAPQKISRAERQRREAACKYRELKMEFDKLLLENRRLTRRLAEFDPSLGLADVVVIGKARRPRGSV